MQVSADIDTMGSGLKTSILCAEVEESLNTTMTFRSKLIWPKDNEPSTYVELVIPDWVQEFLDRYDD